MTEEEEKIEAEKKAAEEKEAEEETKKKAEENTTSPLLEATQAATKDLNDATEASKKERTKMEKVSSDLMLQGKGMMSKPDPVEETPAQYNTRIDKEMSEGKHDD